MQPSDQQPRSLNRANLSPEERKLRRSIALAMLFSPTMCVLPLLAFTAGQSKYGVVIWAVWLLITIALVAVIWRAASGLRKIAEQRLHNESTSNN
ncbi:hypothetical protein [Herpetosiphon sp. NSE202]|uniref:hypothetical protein n=1 Tax=Herpetosiphon sp. NSE202 TaxID=3351349 RepID=UPI003637A2E2